MVNTLDLTYHVPPGVPFTAPVANDPEKKNTCKKKGIVAGDGFGWVMC